MVILFRIILSGSVEHLILNYPVLSSIKYVILPDFGLAKLDKV